MDLARLAKGVAVLTSFVAVLAGTDFALNRGAVSELFQRRVTFFKTLLGAPPEVEPPAEIPLRGAMSQLPLRAPGVRLPQVKAGSKARIPNQTPVIGVTVGGRSRAYLIQAMSLPFTHVLNDYIEGTAVTVTYCDRAECSRVLTRKGSSEPLNVSVAGFFDGKMAIEIDGEVVSQDAKHIALDDMKFYSTTWGQWKTWHPDTDVYVGNFPESRPEAAD